MKNSNFKKIKAFFCYPLYPIPLSLSYLHNISYMSESTLTSSPKAQPPLNETNAVQMGQQILHAKEMSKTNSKYKKQIQKFMEENEIKELKIGEDRVFEIVQKKAGVSNNSAIYHHLEKQGYTKDEIAQFFNGVKQSKIELQGDMEAESKLRVKKTKGIKRKKSSTNNNDVDDNNSTNKKEEKGSRKKVRKQEPMRLV